MCLQVKALAEKLKSSERRRVTPASSPHQLEMDDASVRGGPLARKKKVGLCIEDACLATCCCMLFTVYLYLPCFVC